MSEFIWVQLYIGKKKSGDVDKIWLKQPNNVVVEDIADLRVAVKEKLENALKGYDAADLFVYKTGTEFTAEETPLDPKMKISELNLQDKDTLRVVAPPPPHPPQPAPLVNCRTWSNESNHPGYKLRANSYKELNQQASQKFNLAADKFSLYYIPDGKNIDSRTKIKEDIDLEYFMQLGGNPVVLAWEKGSDGSPKELPGEIAAPFSGSNISSISTSTRGHIQKVFQTAVLARDRQLCVVSGKRCKQGSGNVEAAHIIPVAERKDTDRDAAQTASGLLNLYDTCNGISLEARIHTAFDSYLWCMDEKGIFHLSDAERDAAKIQEYELDKLNGKGLHLNIIGLEKNYPSEQILKARYDLFLAKVKEKKRIGNKKIKASGKKKS